MQNVLQTHSKYPTPAMTVSSTARMGSTLNLHGLTIPLFLSTTNTLSSIPFSDKVILFASLSCDTLSANGVLPCAVATYRLEASRSSQRASWMERKAIKPRARAARAMRKMHVAA